MTRPKTKILVDGEAPGRRLAEALSLDLALHRFKVPLNAIHPD